MDVEGTPLGPRSRGLLSSTGLLLRLAIRGRPREGDIPWASTPHLLIILMAGILSFLPKAVHRKAKPPRDLGHHRVTSSAHRPTGELDMKRLLDQHQSDMLDNSIHYSGESVRSPEFVPPGGPQLLGVLGGMVA